MLGRPWAGDVAIIVGDGPSLTAEALEQVETSGHRTLVVDGAGWLAARWAGFLVFQKFDWFRTNRALVEGSYGGRVLTLSKRAARAVPGLKLVVAPIILPKELPTAVHAIDIAVALGARTVALVGVDSRPEEAEAWREFLPRTRRRRVTIVNASPASEIDLFPRAAIADL